MTCEKVSKEAYFSWIPEVVEEELHRTQSLPCSCQDPSLRMLNFRTLKHAFIPSHDASGQKARMMHEEK